MRPSRSRQACTRVGLHRITWYDAAMNRPETIDRAASASCCAADGCTAAAERVDPVREDVARCDLVRRDLVRQAFRLEWITIGWMTIEAAVAIASGLTAHSLTLLAFGVDSVIELVSACVLIWRLAVELRHGRAFSEHAERTASRIGGGLLFALAAYVGASAAWGFWTAE